MPRPHPPAGRCVFCEIVRGEREAAGVYEDARVVAFLDQRPLLKGHTLLVPRDHIETLDDLPPEEVAPLFGASRLLGRALQRGLASDGVFLAVNVRVSQSVPHLHIHLVPRWEKDGLFSPRMVWKRRPYRDEEERRSYQERVRAAAAALRDEESRR